MHKYNEVFGLDVKAAIRRMHILVSNKPTKQNMDKYRLYYLNKLTTWYPHLDQYQADWLIEHYMNNGFVYLDEEV